MCIYFMTVLEFGIVSCCAIQSKCLVMDSYDKSELYICSVTAHHGYLVKTYTGHFGNFLDMYLNKKI